jgi:glycine/D-amino acid oxidase-like deaminating enzyme
MQRSAQGFWLADASGELETLPPQPPLGETLSADVVVIGGGYLGMWTAWRLAEAGAEVVLAERDLCGHGPSGRNGGFVETWWQSLGTLRSLFGDARALELARLAGDAVGEIERFCRVQAVDAHFVAGGRLNVACSPRQLDLAREGLQACRELGAAEEASELDAGGARALCDSPRFLGGMLWHTGATVHPGRLALGLRRRLIECQEVRILEHSRVTSLTDGRDGVRVRIASGGEVRAGAAVLAINHASAGVAPLRRSLAVASSHVVATEPVPDVLERLGWREGLGIVESRRMLHYFRPTRDGRVVFGWAGGRVALGARRRPQLDSDPEVQDATAAHLVQLLPALRGRRVVHGWGGPIDVSPVHLPWFGSLGHVHYGFGFTGNGVGPAELGGRILADLAAGRDTPLTRLPLARGLPPRRFPPEPLRFGGGALVRRALLRIDDRQAEGRRADPVTALIGAVPRLTGFHLPR